MEKNAFVEQKVVPDEAIDSLGHVNNVVYLKWIQEVSQKHWEKRAEKSIRETMLWVVLSHFIEYKSPCFQGDTLQLHTWVKRMEGVKSVRCVEIYRVTDQKLIVRSETVWCLIDAESKRPKRIPPELQHIFASV